jgi:predicted component of type VI protein secretion system
VSELEPIVVGRSPSCDVVLDSPEVSRNHCRIEALNGSVLVTDLGSRNGTFVNGARIEAPLSIRSDDEVEIGGFCLACSVSGSETALHDPPATTKAKIAPGTSLGRR